MSHAGLALVALITLGDPLPAQTPPAHWQRTMTYGWEDVSEATRPLTAKERALDGGALSSINGLLEGPDGNVWVLDGMNRKIVVFTPTGALGRVIGGNGEGPGEFRRPAQLSADERGTVYVWDRGLSRLTPFDRNGAAGAHTTVLGTGFINLAMAGGRAWFIRAQVSPRHAVVVVDLKSGAVVDSFARISADEVEIGGFGSPGSLARRPDGKVIFAGPRPVQFRVLDGPNAPQIGFNRYPAAEGKTLARGTRVAPVSMRGTAVARDGRIAMLYTFNPAPQDSASVVEYWMEILAPDGRSVARQRFDGVDGVNAIAWTAKGGLLVGVTHDVPKVWLMEEGK